MEEHSSKHFPVNCHGFLFSVLVVNSLSVRFVIFLNAMVLVAMITKPRLQTSLNILLTCLSVTDLLGGLITQTLNVTAALFSLLLDSRFLEFCHVTLDFNTSF